MSLQGQVAMITGGGQGLGRAYGKRLSTEGARVVIADLNGEKASNVAAEIEASGGEALAVQLDVSDPAGVQAMVQKTLERWNRIDILVNNAAYFSTILLKPFEQIPVEEWDLAMAVNLRGTFLCCKEVVPHMKTQSYGRIVNVTSGTVMQGRPNYLHYVTSKAGIIGLTRALAREVGDYGITVNTLCPGLTLTEVPRTTVNESHIAAEVTRQAIKRSGQVDDLAGALSFLVSQDAGFFTGQLVNVDGGLNMY